MLRSTTRLLAPLAALALSSLLACGSKSSAAAEVQQASCDVAGATTPFCQDITVAAGVDLTPLATACATGGGAWATATCATANRVGTCAYVVSPVDTGLTVPASVAERYYPPVPDPGGVGALSAGCASLGGTWTAP